MIMAETIVLSVFNGFSGQLRGIHETFDSDLVIVPQKGKVFELSDSIIFKINQLEHVKASTRILEDDAIFDFKNKQEVVRFKGVEENFFDQNQIDSSIYYGDHYIFQKFPQILVGYGVAAKFGLHVRENNFARIMYPNRKEKVIKKNASAYKDVSVHPRGVFQIEMEYDEKYVVLPLEHARNLTGYEKEISSLEIGLDNYEYEKDVSLKILSFLPENLTIKNRDERHESIYKAIKIEKSMTYFIFLLILFIASLNLYAAMSLLVVSKSKDVSTLSTLGTTISDIRKIFLFEGLMIILSGLVIGLVISFFFILAQDKIGLVSISAESSIIPYIPVDMRWIDFISCTLLTFVVSFIMILKPVLSSTRSVQ